ncbi:MAG: aldo/keto reductase, partial [Pseudomonadota bacterium]
MQRTTLGRTGISVSALCLGSMTWGTQNTEAEGHAQIDMALDQGCDFIDTAEMYPVNPVREETVGDTETIIGTWLAKTGRRGDVVLATKAAGYNESFVRKGQPVTAETLTQALEGSLKRLQTDYVDLYQLHWPTRGSYHFRQMWAFDASKQNKSAELDRMHGIMARLKDLVAEGKIRAFGLSNESAWGTLQWLKAADAEGGPPIASIQNEYSLLCRNFDTDLSEVSCHENVSLLAFSPLATGLLTGKYQGGAVPEGSRMTYGETLGGRVTERVFPAVDAYLDVARRHGLDPSEMAIAWCLTRPFPTIPIFGATTQEQLATALRAAEVTIPSEAMVEIDAIHRAHPFPY